MIKVIANKDIFIDGLVTIIGLDRVKLNEMSPEDLLQIIDHPMLEMTDVQREKISLLKEFINVYQYYRKGDTEQQSFNTPKKFVNYFKSKLENKKDREFFLVAYLDSKMHLLSCDEFQGGINQCIVYPRDLVKRALQLDCIGIVISHNHPSGDPTPSQEDITITRRIVAIFKTMGINIFDHIIIGNDCYYSLEENDYLEDMKSLPNPADILPFDITKISDLEVEFEEEQ
ncbi:JAB domain-containing protein [Anaerocolumna sp. AGMB13020]|uniref:JAB domain-containing protein n=1 Tax=Anaerocolumna sp. AGMB13020 TaxID=3081750 RepID=UPI0029532E2D|nr:JAB domain-containing protein [Anaerocolumna sp. AGMB13020]WOO35783.1 JAB domain-containing protein [Anaerocolumna sp. AGMB13020]